MPEQVLSCATCQKRFRARSYDSGKAYKCPQCQGKLEPTSQADASAQTIVTDGPDAQSAVDPLIGTQVGQYKILAKLGEGGMGAVYKAEHVKLRRLSALKILPQHMVEQSPRAVKRFMREARSAAALSHPNIVTVYNVDEADGYHFIDMELVEGESVQDRLKRDGRFDAEEATRIVGATAQALAAAHEKHIVHRDIKPANILLDEHGSSAGVPSGAERGDSSAGVRSGAERGPTVKVADFGLAKNIEDDSMLTGQGQIGMGTAHFMSPEQCDGEDVDARTDIYSLGVTYYYLLTGNPPFNSTSRLSIMVKHKTAPVPDPREAVPDLPEAACEIISKAMAKKPDERYQTCEGMIDDLTRVASAVGAKPQITAGPRRALAQPRNVAVAAAVAVAVSVVLGFLIAGRGVTSKGERTEQTVGAPSESPAEPGDHAVAPTQRAPEPPPTEGTNEPGPATADTAIARPDREIEDITWTLGPELPGSGRGFCEGPSAGVVQGHLICAGGYFPIPDRVATFTFDIKAQNWSRLPDMPKPRRNLGTAVIGSHLYALGGVGKWKTCAEIFRLSASGGKWRWETVASLAPDRAWSAVGAAGSKLLVAGGMRRVPGRPPYDPTLLMTRAEFLDVTSVHSGWQQLPDIPGRARGWAAGAVVRGRFYLFGGLHLQPGFRNLSETLCLDLESRQWGRKRDLPFPLAGASALAIHDRYVLILGGVRSASTPGEREPSDVVLVYDTEADAFREVPSPMPYHANDMGAVSHGDLVYVAAGVAKSKARRLRIGQIRWSEDAGRSAGRREAEWTKRPPATPPQASRLPPDFERAFMLPDSDKDQHGNVVHVRDGSKADPQTGWAYEIWLKEPRMEFAFVPAGEFMMGNSMSPEEAARMSGRPGRKAEEYYSQAYPRHRVQITKPFYVGKYEVTQLQWQQVMGNRPWDGEKDICEDPRCPAVGASWDDFATFMRLLARAPGTPNLRLPTEAQWEYACRAGSTGAFCYGDEANRLAEYAWYHDNAVGAGEVYAHAVGLKLPNAWGCYDMHGNAKEWCRDWQGPYASGLQVDPSGPSRGSRRMIRGGAFKNSPIGCSSGHRRAHGGRAGPRADVMGTRVVVSLPRQQEAIKHRLPPGFDQAFMLPDSDKDQHGDLAVKRDGQQYDAATGYPYEIWLREPRMEFVLIRAGEFMMGCAGGEPVHQANEEPVHRVRITTPFYVAKYEVTVGQFRAFVNEAAYVTEAERPTGGGRVFDGQKWGHKRDANWKKPYFRKTDRHPVVLVTWNDTQRFSEWLSKKSGSSVSLPTEAQWEYACRAGSRTPYFWGDHGDDAHIYGNVADSSGKWLFSVWKNVTNPDDGFLYAAPVGRFRPNAFGLYDMIGNVYEWCQDRFDPDYYRTSPEADPPGAASGDLHPFRGGAWSDGLRSCAWRIGGQANGARSSYIGFRVMITLGPGIRAMEETTTPATPTVGQATPFELGKSFFAIGVYAGMPEWSPKEMEEAGFNFAICPTSQIDEVVRSTQAMKVCARLRTSRRYSRIKAGDYSIVSPAIEAHRSHARVVGWYLDEPGGVWKVPLSNCRQISQIVKRENPAHRSMAAFSHKLMRQNIPTYATAFDVVLAEAFGIAYGTTEKSMSIIADEMRWARTTVPMDKPMFTVVQCFDVADYGGQGSARAPTPAELRCAAYLGPILGYQGVMFFSARHLAKRPQLMAEAKKIAGELRTLSPVLLGGKDAPGLGFRPNAKVGSFRMMHYGGKTYVFVLNPTDKRIRFHFGGPSVRRPGGAKVLFENRRVTFGVRGFREAFDPLTVRIYEIEGELARLGVTGGSRL